MAKDPVCEMEVNEREAAATYENKGKTYYFCVVGSLELRDGNGYIYTIGR